MIDGYARVPTDGQSVDAQVCQYRAVGAGHVFRGTAREAKEVAGLVETAFRLR